MRLKRIKRNRSVALDLTPLIDVVFLLLIFFMLSSSMIMQSGIKINLPTVKNARVGEVDRLEIKIPSDDGIFVNNRQVTLEELRSILDDVAKEGKMVMIKGDQRASLGRIVSVWDLCKEMGVTRLNIATEIKPGS